jgi:Icc-related predicted phosphoesterase
MKRLTLVFLVVAIQHLVFSETEVLTAAVWSDTHFGAYDFNDPTRLEIIEQINTLGQTAVPEGFSGKSTPELLIHCGDITEKGTGPQWNEPTSPDQRSYLRTLSHLDPRIKAYAALGNHDSRKGENVREAFAAMHGGTYYSFDCKGVHFVVLDPYPEMNSAAPSLDKTQIEWLTADMTKLAANTPVVIVMHILPMYDEGIDRTSRLDQASSEALAAAIAGRNILAFLHGHWHGRSVKEWNGIAVIAPAGFAYYRKGCPNGHPYLGILQITDSAFNVYGYNWESHVFDEKPLYKKDFSRHK